VNYAYKATVIRWVDGDTVWLEVDLGFRMKTINDFRLYGVDTPERGQPGWAEAKAFVQNTAPVGTEVNIETYKDPDKYGRWLAEVSLADEDSDMFSINAELTDRGLAKAYFGGKK
jgi:micrococcal nuclease